MNRYLEIQFAGNFKFFFKIGNRLAGRISRSHIVLSIRSISSFNRSLPGYPLFKTPNKGTIAGTRGAPKFCLAFYLPTRSRVSLDRDQVTRSPRFPASYFRLHRGDDRPPLSSRIVALVNEAFYRGRQRSCTRLPFSTWIVELHANEHTTLVVVELQRRGKKVGGKKNGEEKRAEGKERID